MTPQCPQTKQEKVKCLKSNLGFFSHLAENSHSLEYTSSCRFINGYSISCRVWPLSQRTTMNLWRQSRRLQSKNIFSESSLSCQVKQQFSQLVVNFYKEWKSWIQEQEDNFCPSGQCGIWTPKYEQVSAMTTRPVDPKIKTRLSYQPQYSSNTSIKTDLET